MYVNAMGIALHPVVLSLSPTGCSVMKLTVDQVIEIRKQHEAGTKASSLAIKYGVSQQHIYRLLNNQRWGHRLMLNKNRKAHQALLDAIARQK